MVALNFTSIYAMIAASFVKKSRGPSVAILPMPRSIIEAAGTPLASGFPVHVGSVEL